jgi:phosphoinositide 3-/4-kinase-like protein
MSDIKRWLKKRESSVKEIGKVEKASVNDFVRLLEEEHGSVTSRAFYRMIKANTPFIIAKSAPEDKILEFAERYLTDASFKAQALTSLNSNFHRNLMEKSMQEFVRFTSTLLKNLTLADLVEPLVKAVDQKDWTRVAKQHNPDAPLVSDHAPHLTDFPVHPEYNQMLKDPKKFKAHPLDENGISAKMVHAPSGYTDEKGDFVSRISAPIFMAKPYHKKIESATKSWVKNPILGWSTMATKALFNAGKIGHLAEDVSAHEHEGVPLTVHKFAEGFSQKDPWKRQRHQVNPLELHQIGVMDYLTNNLDRHMGNIMHGEHTNEEGFNPLLAIDHERNFQYHKRVGNNRPGWERKEGWLGPHEKESPFSYIKNSALNQYNKDADTWYSHEDLVNWWSQHGRKIKSALESQVENIKDDSTRKHVRDNFTTRWHKMNNWAERLQSDSNGDDMWNQKSLHDSFEDTWNSPQEKPKISAKTLKSLPSNKKDALFAIADIINKKGKLTQKQTSLLSGAMQETIAQMTPKEAGETFRSIIDNPHMSTGVIKKNPELDARQLMLRHFAEPQGWQNNEPSYKLEHAQEMARTIDSLPSERKEILGHWSERYRRMLAEQRERQAG